MTRPIRLVEIAVDECKMSDRMGATGHDRPERHVAGPAGVIRRAVPGGGFQPAGAASLEDQP